MSLSMGKLGKGPPDVFVVTVSCVMLLHAAQAPSTACFHDRTSRLERRTTRFAHAHISFFFCRAAWAACFTASRRGARPRLHAGVGERHAGPRVHAQHRVLPQAQQAQREVRRARAAALRAKVEVPAADQVHRRCAALPQPQHNPYGNVLGERKAQVRQHGLQRSRPPSPQQGRASRATAMTRCSALVPDAPANSDSSRQMLPTCTGFVMASWRALRSLFAALRRLTWR